MKKYLFAIYPKELRKEDFDQIGGLCPGVTIEELDEDAIEAIIFAFYMTHNAAQHGHCYRFKTDELLPALFMVEKTPAYIGLFNVKDERACTTMGAYLLDACFLATILRSKVKSCRRVFKSRFRQTSHINLNSTKFVLKDLKKDAIVAGDHIKALFDDRRLA